jgi:hypothetical protein
VYKVLFYFRRNFKHGEDSEPTARKGERARQSAVCWVNISPMPGSGGWRQIFVVDTFIAANANFGKKLKAEGWETEKRMGLRTGKGKTVES